jgi:hypothetical protein
MSGEARLAKQSHYLYLLIAILAQLLVYPFLDGTEYKSVILNILSTFVLVTAVYAIGFGRKQLITAIGLGGFAFAGIWYVVFIEPRYYLAILSVICRIAFDVYVISLILVSLFRAKQVTSNTIYGAVSVYLLIGTVFSILYKFMETLMPGSFYIGETGSLDFVYFSITTLTSLGYGDITPVSAYARSATSLQAVIGVLYIAILISRFVGIYIAQHLAKNTRNA